MSGTSQDEFHRLRASYLRLRSALRDPTTNLYAVSLYFDEIRALLSDSPRLGVIWVGLGDRRLIESVYGWESYDRLVRDAAEHLRGQIGSSLPERSILAISGVRADSFALFVPGDEVHGDADADALASWSWTLKEGLEARLAENAHGRAPLSTHARVGASLLSDNPFHRFERRVYETLDEARALAERPRETERLTWLAELQRLLRERRVHSVFQPVVDLESGRVVAFEAYARGPQGSMFSMPRVMFSVGREAGLAGELDRVCRYSAIESIAKTSERPGLLFINTAAESLVDPEWSSPETMAALERAGLSPAQIVLDVPEGELSADPSLYRDAIESLRAVGYRLSLDDIGSSARSVALVEQLRPDYLKFDLTLVRGLGQDQLRRELVRSLVQLAERAGAQLVAERVETDEERRSLIACGARWGQGYFFAPETDQGGGPGRRTPA